jgi:hypothetical protein
VKVETIYLTWDELEFLEHNARYLRNEQFRQLTENIRRDGCLSSTPFVIWNPVTSRWKILSGNHRCKAGQAAGLPGTLCLATRDALTYGQQVALQLSHNAITGEDDLATLKELYESIDDLELKTACGLDDKTLGLLSEINGEGKASASLEWTALTFAFLPDEAQAITRIFLEVQEASKGDVLAVRMRDYDAFMDALQEAGVAANVKNAAASLRVMLDVFGANLGELQQLYADQDDPKGRGTPKQAPLAAVFQTRTLNAHDANLVQRALQKIRDTDRTGTMTPVQALRVMSEYYVAATKNQDMQGVEK